MNVREFRANLAAVLDRAAAGETVEITRDGVPVAVVGPVAVPVSAVSDVDDIDDIDRNLLGRRWIVPLGGDPLNDGRFGCWLSTRMLRGGDDDDCAAAGAPTVLTISDTAPRPVGMWYRRESWEPQYAELTECNDGPSGFRAIVSETHWCVSHVVMSHYKYVGNAGSFAANLLAADAAYRQAIAERAVGEPPPSPESTLGSSPASSHPWWQFTQPFPVGGGDEWRASFDLGGVEYRLRGRPRAPGEIGPSLRDVLGVLVGPAVVADGAHADDLVTEVHRRSLAGGAA